MTKNVQKIAEQVKALPKPEFEEFLSWLMDYELEHADGWDEELERDSQPGGRLDSVLQRVRGDITAGRTKPLDEITRNATLRGSAGLSSLLEGRLKETGKIPIAEVRKKRGLGPDR